MVKACYSTLIHDPPSVTVIYLSWIPYGINLFKDFINSYLLYDAGYSHKLMIIFNGITNQNDLELFTQYAQQMGIEHDHLSYQKGQDLEVYRRAASEISTELILFFNSYTVLQANHWLKKYINAYSQIDIGIVGSTGSLQSYYSTYKNKFPWTWNNALSFKENINNYKLKLKAIIVWRFFFNPYPNPHVRTNAFLMNRKLFLSLEYKDPRTKFEAYTIESGKSSITNQILKRGLHILMIDKYGKAYKIDEWKESKIFWIDAQVNLLISDNQTRYYSNATVEERKYLEHIAWGR